MHANFNTYAQESSDTAESHRLAIFVHFATVIFLQWEISMHIHTWRVLSWLRDQHLEVKTLLLLGETKADIRV